MGLLDGKRALIVGVANWPSLTKMKNYVAG